MSPTDALPKLPPTIARHTVFLLMESLPPPLTDTPEERAARDEAAIASLAVLNPGDAYEARLAARAVAADARATECLRLASVPKLHPDRRPRRRLRRFPLPCPRTTLWPRPIGSPAVARRRPA